MTGENMTAEENSFTPLLPSKFYSPSTKEEGEVESQRLSAQGTGDPPPCEKPIPATHRQESAGRRVSNNCSASGKGGGSEKKKNFLIF
ncbi:MAG: hypothetical protein GF364_16810 [Candidatus Lokiarchaeota archaeon]|nr:hypothetical protein [Candidatus Lokiarchaeota archaeon]